MLLASHQPDLLPWSGFWHKMARADLFDLAIWDQFQRNGYQRRVTMMGRWVGHQVYPHQTFKPINQVRIRPESCDRIIRDVREIYRGCAFWAERGDQVVYLIDEARSELLWLVNTQLIVGIRDILGIKTPISIATKPTEHGPAGIWEVVGMYDNASVYLSGQGAKAYGLEGPGVLWSRHKPASGDSILTTLFTVEDPLSQVLAEES